jgi:uncharacterized protein YjbI with pentapeptide repeats
MANPEHLAILRQGRSAWNDWKLEHRGMRVDLTYAYLSETSMDWAEPDVPGELGIADLEEFNFSGASLAYARLQGANLRGANLFGANLRGANLRRTDLRHADLREVKFNSTNLTLANLGHADVTGSIFWETVLARVNLNRTVGLERCRHGGPSVIDERTLRKSGGLPVEFLRGCGVSDEFIALAKSLITTPIEFYSCFISYSTKDQNFADRLYADLQNKGVRCWFAPHDIKAGEKLHEQIDEAIRLHDKLLLILSPRSMESEWVKAEIAKARKREVHDSRRVLFPIRLVPFETLRDWECFDADTGKDSAREIREYFIPDFSNWKNHDSYQEAFRRLINDLKAQDFDPV